jgi:hypothetical protein
MAASKRTLDADEPRSPKKFKGSAGATQASKTAFKDSKTGAKTASAAVKSKESKEQRAPDAKSPGEQPESFLNGNFTTSLNLSEPDC